METIILRCPNCNAAVEKGQKQCEYCNSPILIRSFKEVDALSPLQTNKYASAYRKALAETPDDREINRSIGICYLKLKLYDKALEAFEKALQDNFDDAEPYFLAAVALLQGKKAFVAPRASIDRATEYLDAANEINPQPVHYYFLAYIKYDYFERKYLNTSPTYTELLEEAAQLGMTDEDADAFFRLLGVPKPDVL